MGGFGSGRRSGFGRGTVEDCLSLDVNRLTRDGCLSPGCRGSSHWTRNGEKLASITRRAEVDRLHLSYQVRINSGEWEEVEETIRVVRVPCHLGGTRPYFICPGVVNGVTCAQRVAKLYFRGRYFLCRRCHQLAHPSQREDEWGRALRRANQLRQRLWGEPDGASPFPTQPKGMWRRTYERLCEQVFEAERLADEAFAIDGERFLSRIENTACHRQRGGRS